MNTIGIICEYNPFHNGHAHQLHILAKQSPQSLLICIMSGAFVQRGEPALFSKFDRARWAVCNGADVVIELPALFSLGSAQYFATGAIRMVKALAIDTLSFGAETTNLAAFQETAQRIDSESTQTSLHTYMQKGLSYSSALRKALMQYQNTSIDDIINSPNAVLGLEYIRAALTYHKGLQYLPILRTSDHHATSVNQNLPSGTALRRAVTEGESIINHIPTTISGDIQQQIQQGHYVDYTRYEDMLHTLSRRMTPEALSAFGDFSEGIEPLWARAALQPTWKESIDTIKSKRYTYARLQRMGAYLALGITKPLLRESQKQGPQYARLLAFNDRGRQWLQQEYTIPIIQKWAKAPVLLSDFGRAMHHIDTIATDMQSLCFHNPSMRKGHTDYTYTPQYIR